MTKSNYLALTWSTSRARDTYGYTICRLDDRETNKRYKCNGGGYDMTGTVIGEWLQDCYQDRLLKLANRFSARYTKADGYKSDNQNNAKLYGGCFHADENRISLDGACGISSMLEIAKAIGIEIKSNYNKRKDATEGFFVSDNVE